MTDVNDSVSMGDNYSGNQITDSPGSAIGRGARASATAYGISGEQLENLFARVYEIIDRVDAPKEDKQRLVSCAEEMKDELEKKAPNANIVARLWGYLKQIPDIASVLRPLIETFTTHSS